MATQISDFQEVNQCKFQAPKELSVPTKQVLENADLNGNARFLSIPVFHFVCVRYNLSCRPDSFPPSFQSEELPQNSSETVELARRPGRSTNSSQIRR